MNGTSMVEKIRTRRRDSFNVPGRWIDSIWLQNPQYGIPGRVDYNSIFSGHQHTVSEGHPFSKLGKTDEDIGGDFLTESVKLVTRPFRFNSHWPDSYGGKSYDGPLFASTRYRDVATLEKFDWERNSIRADSNFLDQRGTTAISRTAPTNPVSSAAQFLGELREGLPSIPGNALRRGIRPDKFGGEYLNVEFGIKPLISDLKKFIEASQKSEKILAQLERDSGRIVRRGHTFPSEVIGDETYTYPSKTYPTFYGSGLTINHLGEGTLTVHTKTTRKVWFSGAFTYHLPPRGTWMRTVSELNKLYGIRITPDTIYQLTPWSWAIDWFSSTGDVVNNLSLFANDGLVLRFGYVMCHTTQVITEEWNGSANFNGTFKPLRLVDTYKIECKQRRTATPFGFGIDLPDLSDRQLAIIAALGLSRSR
jgi:hypothetical protein